MKKNFLIPAFLSLTILMCGCSAQHEADSNIESSEPVTESSAIVSEKEISAPESSDVNTLPEGLSLNGTGMLKFTGYSDGLIVVFPSEICYPDDDYQPENGIYLHNSDGTATLLIDTIKSGGASKNTLAEYLKDTYPDAQVYVSDSREVICKTQKTDNKGNKLHVYLKAKITSWGYNEAILCFRENEQHKYDNYFARISFL